LVRFVLKRDEKYFSPAVRVYAFYTMSNRSRQSGVNGLLRLSDDHLSAQAMIFSEITFPPFGYVLTINSQPPDRDMFDISFFARCRYEDRTDVQLRLPAKSTYSWLPATIDRAKRLGRRSPQDTRPESESLYCVLIWSCSVGSRSRVMDHFTTEIY